MGKNVLVAGLGLIGGSVAKAVKKQHDWTVTGHDISDKVLSDARYLGVIDAYMSEETVSQADFVLVALYPSDTVEFLLAHMAQFKPGAIVVDLCGVKAYVCEAVQAQAAVHGVHFIGGHPMSGREFSGFEYAQADLFEGASMILTPDEKTPDHVLAQADDFFRMLGFARIVHTTPEDHDRMIAFTSQLAHVVSSAYIKSEEAMRHQGYSAGSYRDLTRVARLNEHMWTELFLHNAKPLVREIDEIILHLNEYRQAIINGEADHLRQLLKEGRERKETVG